MKTGVIICGKYRVEKLLGRGGSSSVYLCTNLKLGNSWALKHIPTSKVNERTMLEIEILKKLYHTNLPSIVDVFNDEKGLYIVESNIEGSNLEKLIKQHGSFAYDKVIDWSLELCDILRYLHGVKPNPIIYRDMKPANIILTQSNRLVLVDFGISKEYSSFGTEDEFLAGTSAYAAPEQLIRDGITDQRTDIFNLGATMYQLLYGKVPKGYAEEDMPCRDKAVEKLNGIISKCMESKKSERYQSVEEVSKELSDAKRRLVIGREREKLLFKLELALIFVLSISAYTSMLLGLIICR